MTSVAIAIRNDQSGGARRVPHSPSEQAPTADEEGHEQARWDSGFRLTGREAVGAERYVDGAHQPAPHYVARADVEGVEKARSE